LGLEFEDSGIGRLGLKIELVGTLERLEGDIDGLRLLTGRGSLTAREGMDWLG
jgi:hypothetical protein